LSFTARRLGPEDALAYRDIRLEGLLTEPAAFGSTHEREAPMTSRQWSEQLGRNFTFGVFDGADLLGVATFLPEELEKIAHRAHLVAVYVKPAARGKGASRVLFETLIAEARKHVVQLHLAVTTDNEPARRLYERFGFTVYGTDPRGLKVNGRFYDDYLMVLRLDEGGKESDER
jgi:RimJ/RimL family protein N-acetyltransferase